MWYTAKTVITKPKNNPTNKKSGAVCHKLSSQNPKNKKPPIDTQIRKPNCQAIDKAYSVSILCGCLTGITYSFDGQEATERKSFQKNTPFSYNGTAFSC